MGPRALILAGVAGLLEPALGAGLDQAASENNKRDLQSSREQLFSICTLGRESTEEGSEGTKSQEQENQRQTEEEAEPEPVAGREKKGGREKRSWGRNVL